MHVQCNLDSWVKSGKMEFKKSIEKKCIVYATLYPKVMKKKRKRKKIQYVALFHLAKRLKNVLLISADAEDPILSDLDEDDLPLPAAPLTAGQLPAGAHVLLPTAAEQAAASRIMPPPPTPPAGFRPQTILSPAAVNKAITLQKKVK